MFCFIKIFCNREAVDFIARRVSGVGGRGEIQTRQASEYISPENEPVDVIA